MTMFLRHAGDEWVKPHVKIDSAVTIIEIGNVFSGNLSKNILALQQNPGINGCMPHYIFLSLTHTVKS